MTTNENERTLALPGRPSEALLAGAKKKQMIQHYLGTGAVLVLRLQRNGDSTFLEVGNAGTVLHHSWKIDGKDLWVLDYFDVCEKRIREKGGKLLLTLKEGEGIGRKEFEREICSTAFQMLRDLANGGTLEKDRYEVSWTTGGCGEQTTLKFEFDECHGLCEGIWLLQVEFDTPEQAAAWVPPAEIGEYRDVTDIQAYRGREMAQQRPPDVFAQAS